mmetsp:Transcript_5323/g.13768  ORF Transcript_5323/g.13768 Transcript_5323/m.13768 type:complete len:305 (-) Transcript_5323:766-1680(-)
MHYKGIKYYWSALLALHVRVRSRPGLGCQRHRVLVRLHELLQRGAVFVWVDRRHAPGESGSNRLLARAAGNAEQLPASRRVRALVLKIFTGRGSSCRQGSQRLLLWVRRLRGAGPATPAPLGAPPGLPIPAGRRTACATPNPASGRTPNPVCCSSRSVGSGSTGAGAPAPRGRLGRHGDSRICCRHAVAAPLTRRPGGIGVQLLRLTAPGGLRLGGFGRGLALAGLRWAAQVRRRQGRLLGHVAREGDGLQRARRAGVAPARIPDGLPWQAKSGTPTPALARMAQEGHVACVRRLALLAPLPLL